MSQITTHVLDTSLGKPAKGILIQLLEMKGQSWQILAEGTTDGDGRISDLLAKGQLLQPGNFKMIFHTKHYFSTQQVHGFYPSVEVHFTTINTGHYHIPLLLNPFGYTTYRGS